MLQTFLPLFLMTFGICLFIVLMQFLWRYIDDMVGKGLGIPVLAEMFMYAALFLVPMALPLAILLASLMTFGNLGERLELLAMKSAGVSLIHIMRPLIVTLLFVSVGAFFFQNNVMPVVQVKLYTLLYSMRQKSPELDIPEGSFYKDIPGFNVYVKKKDPKDGLLKDVMIYDYSEGFNNARVIVADSGRLKTSADKLFLVLSLFNGESFENVGKSQANTTQARTAVPYRRESFSSKDILIEFDANFNRTDESFMQNQYMGKNLKDLQTSIDSMGIRLDSIKDVNAIVPLANITADNEEVSPETTDLLATAKKITISGSTPDALEIQALFASNEKVTSIDMTGVIEYFEVPVAANPNCLVYAPASAQVENNNVVINGTAKKIVLTDAMPFEAPTAFHADAISYTRTIEESLTTNAQETTGWRGIVLPFDVSTIQARNKAGEQVELSAYNAEGEYDTSKNPFWLRELTTEGFAATQTFSANTPYIICFPNSSELDEHINIIGDVTFSASNAEITAIPVFNAVEGKDFDMIATLQTVSATEGIYAINNTGSSFVNNSRDIAPFECYVICKQGSTDAPDSFDLPAKLPTAIDNETVIGSKIYTADGNLVIISNEPTEIAVYNITGQMVLMQKVEAGKTIVNDIPHGVYIVNGQKIIL